MPGPEGDRFGRLVLAEWTKLRSVPRWMMTAGLAVGLTILVALLTARGSSSEEAPVDGGEAPDADGGSAEPGNLADFTDEFHLVHQPLQGDGSIVVRVVSQKDSHEWAKAGLMVKQRLEPGAPYAALMVTPDHGVRLQSDFDNDIAGSRTDAPRWLKLSRTGDSVTGYESADGNEWREVGVIELDALPPTVEVGMFVASPEEVKVEIDRQFGGASESVSEEPTLGEATFDSVRLEGDGTTGSSVWSDYDGSMLPGLGGSSEADGVFTLNGSGDIGENDFGPHAGEDLIQTSLMGTIIGLLAVVALGVLFMSAEYKRDMIRTTFAATPGRGKVLAAKALVIGGAMFVAGLIASLSSFLIAFPMLRANGFGDGDHADVGLSDPTVLRAVVGTAGLFAAVGVFSLAVAAVFRRSATAITLVIMLLVFPQIVVTGLPLSVANWITRLTPSAGFAIFQTIERYDTAIAPFAGLGVLCAYTAGSLGGALWLLRRRDV